MTPVASPEVGGERVFPPIIGGKYRPLDVIGAGSTGIVYLVEHAVTGELLALKLMSAHLGASPDAIARFKREARAVSKIRSPHVVRIFDADVSRELGGAPYLVMDLLEGVDLEQLSCGACVERETVVEWLWQIAPTLDQAHCAGIVHRDLKPENLFLTKRDDGRPLVKILDFGIAKIVADSPSTTQSGLIFGTPLYMAPEQANGDPTEVGPAADLYALGLTAYQLLTGSTYRTATSLPAVLEEIRNVPLRTPSELGHAFGPEFDVWFLRACHCDPGQRFGSAAEQVDALARALDVRPQTEAPLLDQRTSKEASPEWLGRDPGPLSGPVIKPRHLAVRRSAGGMAKETDTVGMTISGAPKVRRWRPTLLAFALLALACAAFAFARAKSLALPVRASAPARTADPSGESPGPAKPVGVTTQAPPEVAGPEPSASSGSSVAPSTVRPPSSVGPITVPHPLPIRTTPARPFAAPRKGQLDDEALSDQQ